MPKNKAVTGSRSPKTSRQLERHLKGVANHWRIEILLLIAEREDLSLDLIAREVGGNLKTIAEHVRRLGHAGLICKEYRGRSVAHSLSPYGRIFIRFLKIFSLSPSSAEAPAGR
ncbi:MAG: winged helix-turn-helix transcriptional regulator [Candidatus Liptonbacteria bacterium]|nr:winged helix-turn-helix transcriptional regulator [Candidatus Liptonbacteria bacterium]